MTTYTVNNTEQEKKIYCGREYEHNPTTNTQYNYIYVGDMPVALYVQGDTNAMYTLHSNYIGSIEKISDTYGNVVDSMSYTPFGQRRMFSDWSKTDTATHFIDRGFTGQQHLDEFALINFNGRMYDPVLAHFLSPDPYIQSPENPLNYNRYSYCLFSPLQYVDPSGLLIGDYYDIYGNYLGNDGIYDGKVYIVTNNNDIDKIKKNELEKRTTSLSEVSSAIDLRTSSEIRTEIINGIICREHEDNLREYGGIVRDGDDVQFIDWGSPSERWNGGKIVEFDYNTCKGHGAFLMFFHSHFPGKLEVGVQQVPSDVDRDNVIYDKSRRYGANVVISTKNNSVYFINNDGTYFQMDINTFKTIKNLHTNVQ